MPKTLTKAEILAAQDDGATFEFENEKLRTIEGFNDLVAQLKELVAAQRANAGADMLRSETQSEIVALLQKLVSRPISPVDLSPLAELIAGLQDTKHDRATYHFDVKRDGRGFMESITATPVQPTQH